MKIFTRLFLGAAVLLGICSCQVAPNVQEKIVLQKQAPSSRDSAELAYEVARQTWCSNDDACSLVLLLVDGEDRYLSFEDRRVALHVKGLADIDWDLQADEPVTKGTMSYMICRALGMKGGIMMQILPGRRYAYREAVYHGLIRQGSEYEPLTGPEAVGVLGRAGRFSSRGS